MNEKRNNCLFVFRAQHAMQQYTDLIKRYGNYSIDATKAHWKPAALAGGVIVGIWWLWMWRKYTAFKADIYNKLQTLSSTKAIGSDTIQYTTYGEGDYPILVRKLGLVSLEKLLIIIFRYSMDHPVVLTREYGLLKHVSKKMKRFRSERDKYSKLPHNMTETNMINQSPMQIHRTHSFRSKKKSSN
jgi:hypothetical protein